MPVASHLTDLLALLALALIWRASTLIKIAVDVPPLTVAAGAHRARYRPAAPRPTDDWAAERAVVPGRRDGHSGGPWLQFLALGVLPQPDVAQRRARP